MAEDKHDADPGIMAGGLLIRSTKSDNGFKAPEPRASLLGNASGEAITLYNSTRMHSFEHTSARAITAGVAQGWTSLPDKSEKRKESKQVHLVGPSLPRFGDIYADLLTEEYAIEVTSTFRETPA